MDNYHRLFGTNPKNAFLSLLAKDNHPELDTSEVLDDAGI